MKFTYDWLKDYLIGAFLPSDIESTLNKIGLEVEEVVVTPVPIVVKIESAMDIPDTKLKLCMVDDGTGVSKQIVCGGHNARAGLITALAQPGTKVGDITIGIGKIRGYESHGMLCSKRELGRGDDHDGIIELEGRVIGEAVPSETEPEILFKTSITPNRPDYLAVRGIARDLSAAGIGTIKDIKPYYEKDSQKGTREVFVENNIGCPVYYMCEIRDIKMAKSSDVITRRLSAIGINPRNACVDATNYVMFDIGQPMHCFDADKVNGDIIVRNAKMGEKFIDLFGTEHELIDTDLVIADTDGILALAGIIGGERSGTSDDTKNIILESAYFDPMTIRKTRTRLKLSTDASYRYERGIDPTISVQGFSMAVKIITEACGGTVHTPFYSINKQEPKVAIFLSENNDQWLLPESEFRRARDPRRIKYDTGLFKKMTGIELSNEEQHSILKRLGFEIQTAGDTWIITPTPARVDVILPENIVSEIIRIYGYDNIKTRPRTMETNHDIKIPNLKHALCARGLNEVVTISLVDSVKEELVSDKTPVKLLNPVIEAWNVMRTSLVQSMLDVIANNDRFRRSNLNLFEIGSVFTGNKPGEQHDQLIVARTGIAGQNIGAKHGREVSIYDVRDDLVAIMNNEQLTVNNYNDDAPKWANPYRGGKIILDGKVVAQFGELHPKIAREFGIKTNVVIGVVENASFVPEQKAKYEHEPRTQATTNDFPELPLITRDFAFVVGADVNPDDIVKVITIHDLRIQHF